MIYFMKDKNGKLGHPTRRADMITKHLKRGTIKIISRTKDTLTVQFLDKEFHDEDTVDAEFRMSIDPGVNHIAFAVHKIFKNKITLLLSGELETRTSNVSKNLIERKMYRNIRRRNRRKKALRKFSKAKFRKPIWENRAKHSFQPTHRHLITTHINLIKWLYKRIPINKFHIEYAKFDMQKIINPKLFSIWYQRGPQYTFENVKAYVRSRDNYTCQLCKKSCLDNNEVHHIIPRNQGGTDKPSNLILLHNTCHKKIHAGKAKCPSIKNMNFKHAGLINSCMKKLYNLLEDKFVIQDTLGSIVKTVRLHNNLSKTHEMDAKIINLCDSLSFQDIQDYDYIELDNHIYGNQYRRHDRAWVKRIEDRKYYSNGKIVAWNRNKRSGQSKDSLVDLKQKNLYSQVIAKPGKNIYRRSNTNRRFKPGDLINYNGVIDICKGWASTQCKVILEHYGYVKQRECQVIRNNSGLVLI